jgi:hypothetical protein
VDVVAGGKIATAVTMCYHSAMKWLQWNPDRNGIIGVIFALVVILSVFAVFVVYFPDYQQRRANAGFGPDWDCVVQAKGDPVCTKKPGP